MQGAITAGNAEYFDVALLKFTGKLAHLSQSFRGMAGTFVADYEPKLQNPVGLFFIGPGMRI
jgi:hypothetical protein